MPIRAICQCGFPFPPDRSYDGTGPWVYHRPRRWCSKRCGRVYPARQRAYERAQQKARDRLAAWERVGQLTLW